MRQFIKFFFASFFGTIVGLVVIFGIGFIMLMGVAGAVSKAEEKVEAKPNSVLHIKLDYDITERANNDPFAQFGSFDTGKRPGLYEIINSIEAAKSDDNIKGIYIEASVIPAGFATVEAIRNSLLDFQSSGKFIVAYGEVISQKTYYLASVADEIYVNPVGYLDFRGLNAELMFLKGMLDKLEIEPQVIYAGKYKSATEPFRLDSMSNENEEQITALLDGFYAQLKKGISTEREIPESMVDSIADNFLVRDLDDAVKLKMIDGTLYFDQVLAKLKEKTGIDEKDKLSLVSLSKYGGKDEDKKAGKDRIAVLFAEGSIIDGKGEDDEIGSETYAKIIRQIREDDKVKALVFRINSGGGSALASDVILREIELLKEKGIPIIVSMGDVAASGGYYIACKADTIVAQPNTVTGSIGVFGLLLNMKGFFNNKMGITFDGVSTGKFSDLGTTSRPLTKEEEMMIQVEIDSIYMEFKEHVAAGRGMSVDEVNNIGQGRVWTGTQALQHGLVDVLAGLDSAIAIAARKANLTEYAIKEYPRQKAPFEKFFEGFSSETESSIMKKKLGEHYTSWQKMEALMKMNGIQARMPFEIEIY